MKKISLAILTCAALLAGCQSVPQADPVVADVQAALKKDEYLAKQEKIKVDGEEGKIVLSGLVDNEFQQYHSGVVAKGVKGVKTVENKIKVDE